MATLDRFHCSNIYSLNAFTVLISTRVHTLAHCSIPYLRSPSSIPQVDLVWNFVGSMGGLLIVYILPPLYYLRIKFMHLRFRGQPGQPILSVWCNNDSHAGRLKDVIALAIMCLGVVSMIASNYTAIRAIVDAPGQQAMPPCRYWLNVTESFNITNITATY